MSTNLIIVLGAVAGIILGIISNWIYDLLKQNGVLPDNPTLKRLSIVFFILMPSLIFMVALPEMITQQTIADVPENVIASERVLACMQQHGMKQAKEIIVLVDDWDKQNLTSRVFTRCDWPPLPYSDPDGYHSIKVDSVPGPEFFMDLSNAEMTVPIADRIHSNCKVLRIGLYFTNAGAGVPLQPFEMVAGGISGRGDRNWTNDDLGFFVERDETVLLHTFAESIDLVECVK